MQKWSGREARALRDALRMSLRDFAAYLGVGERTVSKWEAAGSARTPRPLMQQALDTALSRASDEARARFELILQQQPVAALDAGDLADESTAEDGSTPGGVSTRAYEDLAESFADTVILYLLLDGREVAVPLSRRLLMQAGVGTLVEAFALPQQYDVLKELSVRPGLVGRIRITSPAHLQEVLLYLREQWHTLVKTDNLLGPRRMSRSS